MQAMLREVLELTDQVQAAIDAGDWQRAQGLEEQRRARLEQLVVEQSASAHLGAALSELAANNHRLIGLVEHHKRRVLREAATVKTAHAGAAAYAETGAT
jgi:hypothetical protein